MIVKELTLENFRQFKGPHTLHFFPGFNLIQGKNGHGKTSVLYGIYFALFHSTLKRITFDELISFKEQYLAVSLVFECLGQTYKITRKHFRNGTDEDAFYEWVPAKNHFTKTKETKQSEITARIEALTRIRQTEFERIVYAKQKKFYEIVEGDKDFMDAVLKVRPLTFLDETLHKMVLKEKETKKQSDLYGQYEKMIEQNQKTITGHNELKDTITKNLTDLKTERQNLKDSYIQYRALNKSLDTLSTPINQLIGYNNRQIAKEDDIKKQSTNKADFVRIHGTMDSLKNRLEEFSKKEKEFEKEFESLNQRLQEKKEMSGALDSQSIEIMRTIRNLQGLEGKPECPLCKQPVTAAHLKDEVRRLEETQDDIKVKQGKNQNEINKLNKSIDELKTIQKQDLNEAEKLKRDIQSLEQFDKVIGEARQVKDEAEKRFNELLMTFVPSFNRTVEQYNTTFGQSIAVQEKPSIHFIDNTYKSMVANVTLKQNEFNSSFTKLEEQIRDVKTQSETIVKGIQGAEKAIEDAKTGMHDIEFTLFLDQRVRELGGVMKRLIEEFREKKVAQLNEYTLEWYYRLVTEALFRDIRIDKENYRVSVLPIQKIVEADEYMDVGKVASGGHETFIAIAERLALLDIFGLKFGLFDEITDNADTYNARNVITELAQSGEYLDQVIAVTHFEVGKEFAGNLIHILPILDKSDKYTGWSQIG